MNNKEAIKKICSLIRRYKVSIVIILLVPFLTMMLLKGTLYIGHKIYQWTGWYIITIDFKESISLGEYYYYYSQLLLAFATIVLSGVLVYFAFKDYEEDYLKKFSVEFETSTIGYFVTDMTRFFLHLPITFVNRSKQSGWISDIVVKILDGNNNITELRAGFFVNVKNNYQINKNGDKEEYYVDSINTSFNDGLPFTNIPLKSEEVLREFITFKQSIDYSPKTLFKEGKSYTLKMELYIDGNIEAHETNYYKMIISNDLWTLIKGDSGNNRKIFELKKCTLDD